MLQAKVENEKLGWKGGHHRDRRDAINYTAGDKQLSTETNKLYEEAGRSDDDDEGVWPPVVTLDFVLGQDAGLLSCLGAELLMFNHTGLWLEVS